MSSCRRNSVLAIRRTTPSPTTVAVGRQPRRAEISPRIAPGGAVAGLAVLQQELSVLVRLKLSAQYQVYAITLVTLGNEGPIPCLRPAWLRVPVDPGPIRSVPSQSADRAPASAVRPYLCVSCQVCTFSRTIGMADVPSSRRRRSSRSLPSNRRPMS